MKSNRGITSQSMAAGKVRGHEGSPPHWYPEDSIGDDRQSGRKDNRRYDDRTQSNQSVPQRPAFQNGIPTGPRADRHKNTSAVSQDSPMHPPLLPSGSEPPPPPPKEMTPPPPKDSSTPYVPPLTDTDLSAIRSRYLGVDKKKRKIRKMSDKKFVFDWDEQEDTFANAPTPVNGSTAPVGSVMFGRGHLAGMDDGGAQESMLNNRHADPLERRKAHKGGGDERHWSEKSLEEMKDRDWRIFREDFSIATRGTTSLSCTYHTQFLIPHAQVARSRFHFVHGENPSFPPKSWR